MTALLALEPRTAGEETVEPTVEFTSLADRLHMRTRCVPTCTCSSASSVCGRSTAI